MLDYLLQALVLYQHSLQQITICTESSIKSNLSYLHVQVNSTSKIGTLGKCKNVGKIGPVFVILVNQ